MVTFLRPSYYLNYGNFHQYDTDKMNGNEPYIALLLVTMFCYDVTIGTCILNLRESYNMIPLMQLIADVHFTYPATVPRELPHGELPQSNRPLEDFPPANFPLEDSPLSGGAGNLMEGQHYVICFLLAMIFEGAIVHSDIHGRKIGGNSPGGNIPGADLMGRGGGGGFSLYAATVNIIMDVYLHDIIIQKNRYKD